MSWIRVDLPLLKSLKTRHAAKYLDLTLVELRGHLLTLWAWVAEQKPDGELVGLDESDIAWAAEYEGEPKAFVEALVLAGLLDHDGPYSVHDWEKYQRPPPSTERTKAFREREKIKPSQGTSGTVANPSDSETHDQNSGTVLERSGNVLERSHGTVRHDTIQEDKRAPEVSGDLFASAPTQPKPAKPRAPKPPREEHPDTDAALAAYKALREAHRGTAWSATDQDRKTISALLAKSSLDVVKRAIEKLFDSEFRRKENLITLQFLATPKHWEQLSEPQAVRQRARFTPKPGSLEETRQAAERAREREQG